MTRGAEALKQINPEGLSAPELPREEMVNGEGGAYSSLSLAALT